MIERSDEVCGNTNILDKDWTKIKGRSGRKYR